MRRTILPCVVVSTWIVSSASAAEPSSRPARLSIFQRTSAAQLDRFDRDRGALAARVKPIAVPYPFVRSTLHMHSERSHDSRGTVSEIIAAAKATGTKVVGFSEHPSRTTADVAAAVSGWRDGVYFLAGTESGNTLHWPARDSAADLRFVSHPEEVPTFDRSRFAGMEIYNTHTDAKDEPTKKLLSALILNLAAVRAHPQAAFESFLDYPADFMARFDQLTRAAPFSGIAANDSHQNQGFTVIAEPDGSVQVLDATSDPVWTGEGIKAAMLLAAFGQTTRPASSTVLTRFQLDPYEISMRHVGTFLQIDKISEGSVRHALRTGRIILGFEIVAPLPQVGFWIECDGKPVATVGDRLAWRSGLTLRVALPTEAATVRILRNGEPIHRQEQAKTCTRAGLESGVYRLEAFQSLAGQEWPWVISNPIYILASESEDLPQAGP